MTRRRALVVCPGRGTYNVPELGYLARHHAGRADLLAPFEAERRQLGQPTLAELDGAAGYSLAVHTRGDNASALIFAASLADAAAIDTDAIEVVAVTGNSMGWYTALAVAGAVSAGNGFRIANTMGSLMQAHMIGGQLVYPVVGEDWRPDPEREAALLARVGEIDARTEARLSLSIRLGGMLVLAGNEAGLKAFEASVPVIDKRFPMRLGNHAAFHTDLQAPVAQEGRDRLEAGLFGSPALPLIDGRGAIWWPKASDAETLRAYTLGHQVTQPYDFTRAMTVGLREFAPDVVIVTGPGTTLGGAVAQTMIAAGWRGLCDKTDFQRRQEEAPLLIAMGMEAQRPLATGASTA